MPPIPAAPTSETIHATSVAIDGRGVVIEGASGAGKSDLALRLIDRGAVLVSDDYTILQRVEGALLASPPDTIAGKIEVRGIGIVALPHVAAIEVALVVRLADTPRRMPESRETRQIAGCHIPVVEIDPRAASAAIKVELALRPAMEAA